MSNIQNIYPLAPIQEGLLFHTINGANRGAYFQQLHWEITGELDVAKLHQAWDRVVQRHDVLRTLFTWERRDRPLQIVRGEVELPWEVETWTALPTAVQTERFQTLLDQDRKAGFELTKAPLMRCTLIQLAPQRYRFLWSFHHLLLDGWSAYLVLGEVFAAYAALVDGRRWLPPPVAPYAAYVQWQKKQDQTAAESFWRAALAGYDTPNQLDVYQAPSLSEAASQGSGQLSCTLSAEATTKLKAFARAQKVTLNTVFQGAWSILLSRYCDEQDVVFGLTSSGRPPELPQSDKIVGVMLNTLPVRTDVASDASLTPWLQAIQQWTAEMRAFESTPLASVQRWSDLPAGQPLFNTILVVENYPAVGQLAPPSSGIQVQPIEHIEQSNYPLAILVLPHDELEILAIYDKAVYRQEVVEQLLGHLQTLLGDMVANPTQHVGTVQMLPNAERQQMLVDWNQSVQPKSGESRAIHQLIEAHAATTPLQTAVVFGETKLSYQQLNERANQLGHALQQKGVESGQPVALLFDRSVHMIIGILGVLKVGGAYVPLDPTYPSERIQFILQDLAVDTGSSSRSKVFVVTDGQIDGVDLLADVAGQIVSIDLSRPAVLAQPTTPLDLAIDLDTRAYIIYTSGSTGTPKGVEVSHRQILHSTTARQHVYDKPFNSFLLLSSYAFDSSLVGIFWSLCTGATLVLTPHRIEQDILAIESLIVTHRVSHLLCLPSLYRLILTYADVSNLQRLRVVIVAGEACPSGLAKIHHDCLPSTDLYNEYGPTEGTVWSSVYRLASAVVPHPVPIGRPIPNMRIYLLDGDLRPVPQGVSGNLYIAGEGVAIGYFNRPALTNERFFWHQLGSRRERLYQTGDVGRYLPNGDIQFMGRQDHQIKIRGYRVELGEIESALKGYGNGLVTEALVVAHQPRERIDSQDTEGLAAMLGRLDPAVVAQLLQEIGATTDPETEMV